MLSRVPAIRGPMLMEALTSGALLGLPEAREKSGKMAVPKSATIAGTQSSGLPASNIRPVDTAQTAEAAAADLLFEVERECNMPQIASGSQLAVRSNV